MNEATKLRRPEIEVQYRRKNLDLYDADSSFIIRQPHPPHCVVGAPNWYADPHGDRTWQLYFHSLYWLGTLAYGIDLRSEDDPVLAASYRTAMKDILMSHVELVLSSEHVPSAVWDDHAAAYRASYVAYCFEAYVKSLLVDEERAKLLAYVKAHIETLIGFIRSPRWNSSNHTLFHVEGLADASYIFFRDEPWGASNLALARDTLQAFIERTISPGDGTTKEHALFYHAFTMERVRQCSKFLEGLGYPVTLDLKLLFRKMNTFLWTVMPWERHVPPVGDTKVDMIVDNKYISAFDGEEYTSEITRYLRSGRVEGTCPPRLSAFRDDGYYVFRDLNSADQELYALFLEKKYIGPHGHVDGNSFIAYFCGEPFISEGGGPYKYGDRLRYEYFQTQLAHNTVVFKRPERYLSAVIDCCDMEPAQFVFGRANYPSGDQWLRGFGKVGAKALLVVDLAVPAEGDVQPSLLYHLADHLKISNHVGGVIEVFGRNSSAIIKFQEAAVALSVAGPTSNPGRTSEGGVSEHDGQLSGVVFDSLVTRRDGQFERSHLVARKLKPFVPHITVISFAGYPSVAISGAGRDLVIHLEIGKSVVELQVAYSVDDCGAWACSVLGMRSS
jgi:hypothetical protein